MCRVHSAADGRGAELVFKAHRLLYHSTLGLRVIKKRRRMAGGQTRSDVGALAVPLDDCRHLCLLPGHL